MDMKQLLDILWIVVASSLVFFMQAGFSLVESGLTRSKNSINVAVKNLTDLGVSILCFWAVGFALMFGDSLGGLTGRSNFFYVFSGSALLMPAAFFLFQAMFCSTSATIVSGAVAERMRFSSYIVSTLFLSLLIYPVFGHWAWGGLGGESIGSGTGWLASLGFVDFAGSSVVHSVGGWTALAILLIIGPRKGRYDEEGRVRPTPASSIPVTVGGVVILWFGWIGFNGGSTLAMNDQVPGIIMRTCLAASAGMVGSLAYGWTTTKTAKVDFLLNGTLAGLVAITAPCHAVSEVESIIIGAVGGVVMILCSDLLNRFRIDDAVGAIPVHLAAGIWGTLAVGIFGDPELLGTQPWLGSQILVQLIGVAACGLWSFLATYLILFTINKISPLRVSAEAEQTGLNVAEHGASTETYQLFQVMEEQARSGDLSLRVPVEPFTEVGQIARRYNMALDGFQENSVAREDYQNILDNVTDGLFLVDRDGVISPNHSTAAARIFSKEDLAGMNLLKITGEMLPDRESDSFADYFPLLFDPKMKTRTLNRLNPLTEAAFYIDSGRGEFITRHLSFRFNRIVKEEGIILLMVLVKDLTMEKELQQEMERERSKSKSEMEMFYSILHLEPELFNEFIVSAENDLDSINRILESEVGDHHRRINLIFQYAHSIKGNAALLELDFIAERAHDFEDKIEIIRGKEEILNEDFLSLTVILSELYGVINQVQQLMEKLINFRRSLAESSWKGGELMALSLKKLAEKTAGDLNKKVRFVFSDFKSREIPSALRKPLKDLMIQLVRNAVTHGIETEEERVNRGKEPAGTISIAARNEGGALSLSVRDNGRGIDFSKLREHYLAAHPQGDPDKTDLFRTIFSPGTSTADRITPHSGRGVGMSLVQSVLNDLKAKLVVRTGESQFCEFNITVPLGESQ